MRTRSRNSSGRWASGKKDSEVTTPSAEDQRQLTAYVPQEAQMVFMPPKPRVVRMPNESKPNMFTTLASWLTKIQYVDTPAFLQAIIFFFGVLAALLRFAVFLVTLIFFKSLLFWDQSSNLTQAIFAWISGNYMPGMISDAVFPEESSSQSYQLQFSVLPAAGEYEMFHVEVALLLNNPVVWLLTLVLLWTTHRLLAMTIDHLKKAKEVVAFHQALYK